MIFCAESLILDTKDFGTERVNTGIGSSFVSTIGSQIDIVKRQSIGLLVLSREATIDQRECDHIVNGMAMGVGAFREYRSQQVEGWHTLCRQNYPEGLACRLY